MVSGMLGGIFFLGYVGVAIWVTYMFYRALARIGEELSYIRSVLHQRLPPGPPEPATRRPDLNGTV